MYVHDWICKIKPNINDTLMHCPETLLQICFHRWLFAGPVKPLWCITGSVEPLGSTNQNWLGCQTVVNVRLNLSCGLCTYLSPTENTALLSLP